MPCVLICFFMFCKDNANREQNQQARLNALPRCSLSYVKIHFCTSKQIGRAKTICARIIRRFRNYIKKEALNFFKTSCGADGTRTRDPMRDRHVF